jgi:NitT/TauT family transport system substrate-binding protein
MIADVLRTGRMDAVSTWNPALTMKSQELGKNFCIMNDQKIYTFDFCAVAGREFVGEKPETVKKFLQALIKAEQFLKRHPDEAVRLAARFARVDETLFRNVWELYDYQVTLDQSLVINLEDQSRWAIEHSLTVRRDMPNYLDFIHIGGLKAVKPETVRIIR